MLKSLLTGFVVGMSALTLGASAPMDVKVNPRIALKPTNVTAFVKLDEHPDNRWLKFEIASVNYGESSVKQLEGVDAPQTLTHTFKDVRPGRYLLVVTLMRSQDKVFSVDTDFCIGGPGVDCVE